MQNGKYGLTEVIGQGGFGITYSGVWNTEVKGELGAVKTAVPICIKEYFFKDYCYRDPATMQVCVHSETGRMLFDKFREKQIEEARILSEVHHPYIVNVLEVFEENNTAYIAMERIDGQSLKSILEGCERLPEQRALKYIGQIGRALEFVHGKSILHLDIKPGNILIDTHDDARLIDFGVSKRYDIGDQATSTTTLTLSKGFASIEQYDSDGLAGFSPRPDIYSLGATLYNLLTGCVPPESILRVTKPLVKPSELNADITPKTEHAILKALQVDPADRYPSVRALLNDLDIPPYPEKEDHPISTEAHPTPAPTATDDERHLCARDLRRERPRAHVPPHLHPQRLRARSPLPRARLHRNRRRPQALRLRPTRPLRAHPHRGRGADPRRWAAAHGASVRHREGRPHYQSRAFGRLLTYIGLHPRACQLREQNGRRSIVIRNVASVAAAVRCLTEVERTEPEAG